MTSVSHSARHTAVGTLQNFIASGLSLPTGLITAAFLTRKLGPHDYGLYTVAVTIIVLVEISITLGFNRTAVKFVSESSQWKAVASSLLKTQFLVSILAAVVLLAAAPMLGAWLDSPDLSKYLALFSLDIPLCAMAGIHRSILIGRGWFGLRAILTAIYWIIRMTLIILFVTLQPTITAALLACIGTSASLLCVARIFIRPPLFKRS
ncbi:MAG: oligosaccharide flippase family protein, partial [Deltaproteobacteria bacterium]|nr:oligosaccharide flippase family protein [Deltaproteobacteria bacterium]